MRHAPALPQRPTPAPLVWPPAASPPGADRVPPPRPVYGGPVTRTASLPAPPRLTEPPRGEMPSRKKRPGRKKGRSLPSDPRERLVAQMRARETREGKVWELDLRNQEWGRDPAKGLAKRPVLRCPTDPGWPEHGRTTSDRATAEAWVREHYRALIQRESALAGSKGSAALRVDEACDRYIESLVASHGADHRTTTNRRSACRAHIKPSLGSLPMAALSEETVRKFLEGLQVTLHSGGVTQKAPAAPATRANVRDTLSAVWRHTYPDVKVPFADAKVVVASQSKRRRDEVKAGNIGKLIAERATVYTRDQVLEILTAAMWYDQERLALPNVAVRVLPNTAEFIALQLGTAARVEEVTDLRWSCLFWDQQAIFVPGTKSFQAPRWIPMQRSLEPWLRRLRAVQGGARDSESFVIQTHPRQPRTAASTKIYQARISRVLALAGLKLPRKSTHIFRATHMSWGSPLIPSPALKAYAGHGEQHGGVTDRYVATLPDWIPAEHRHYIDLPTPEEIVARLPHFEPASWPDERLLVGGAAKTK